MKKAKQHGGPRPNSGRPKKADKRKVVSMTFAPDVVAWLNSLECKSIEVEEILRRSKNFKEWKAANV